MRRFDIPAAPPVAGGRGDLLRLVDPLGLAVAWLDLRAGAVIGYAVRPDGVAVGGWRELLGGTGPDADDDRESPVVGTIAVGWPWADELPLDPPARWRLVERDPTAATCVCPCVSRVDRGRVAELALDAWLEEGLLRLRLAARSAGAAAKLRPHFRLTLPGTSTTTARCAAPEMAEGRLAFRHADASLRLAAGQEPGRHVCWSGTTNAVGTIYMVLAMPPGAPVDADNACILTLMVGPLD